jgi:hypothetical protein
VTAVKAGRIAAFAVAAGVALLVSCPAMAQGTAGTAGATGGTVAAGAALPQPAELDRMARAYRERWENHPRGQWLLRLLPVRLLPSQLPEAESEPARLTARYCVQCHALPSPAMHGAKRWEAVVERMLPRMRGEGNEGRLMHEMMEGLQAPDARQAKAIIDYLSRHAQRPLPLEEYGGLERNRRGAAVVPGRLALTLALATEDGIMYQRACNQCHELPDPAAHRAVEWPAVVSRMQDNMEWMNRVVGSKPDPRAPRFDPQRIIDFLQAHAGDRQDATPEHPTPRPTKTSGRERSGPR